MATIDPNLEESLREILIEALRLDFEEFGRSLAKLDSDGTLIGALKLTSQISAVICIDLSDGRAPDTDDLREIADTTEHIDQNFDLTADRVYPYLTRFVFGGEALDAVLGSDDVVHLPFMITANLLASTADVENGQDWLAYLDAVETAIEKAPEPG